MKNIKNTVAAMGLMAVLGLGATAANAGIMLSDRSVNGAQPICNTETGVLNQLGGIIIVGLAGSRTGIMLSDRFGIMLSDRSTPCTQNTVEGQNNDGIIIVG